MAYQPNILLIDCWV